MNYPEYERIIKQFPCALLIDEVKVEKIIAAIQQLDESPALWQSMSDACTRAAKEFTWENESMKLVEIYRRL